MIVIQNDSNNAYYNHYKNYANDGFRFHILSIITLAFCHVY